MSEIINLEYIENLSKQIRAVRGPNACAELQKLVTRAFEMIAAEQEALNAQLAEIAPLLALLKVPTSLSAILSWVKNFINAFLKPYLQPYITMMAQVAQLAIAVASLQAAVQEALSNITECEFELPTLPGIQIPDAPGLDDLLPPIPVPPIPGSGS